MFHQQYQIQNHIKKVFLKMQLLLILLSSQKLCDLSVPVNKKPHKQLTVLQKYRTLKEDSSLSLSHTAGTTAP